MIKDQLQAIALPEWGQLAEEAVRRVPRITSLALRGALFVLAPHQRRLSLKLCVWDKRVCEAEMPVNKRNWLRLGRKTGTTDFASAGELVASLVLVRNLNVFKYSFQLKELNVVADREPDSIVHVACELDPQSFTKLRMVLTEKGEATLTLKSTITNTNDVSVAQVRSVWLVKKRR